jgi:Gly-Xaa carboxypeptidase
MGTVLDMSTGNTDTQFYWNLTKNNIFRYDHLKAGDGVNIHTVDEHVRATAIPTMVRFFVNLILNADESKTL